MQAELETHPDHGRMMQSPTAETSINIPISEEMPEAGKGDHALPFHPEGLHGAPVALGTGSDEPSNILQQLQNSHRVPHQLGCCIKGHGCYGPQLAFSMPEHRPSYRQASQQGSS